MAESRAEKIEKLMQSISICRDEDCIVPKKHPFYPTPDQPPFYFGKRPCMSVVPTNLATDKIMMIGEYPNCRFGSLPALNGSGDEDFLPVADIDEPFTGGRYFDGRSVREYPTETSLQENYLLPLGLDLRSDIWLTNINKCFLMKPSHIKNYADVGWSVPPTEASFTSDQNYFDIAAVCVMRHLVAELQLCQPKLIIAFGEKAYRMIHSQNDFTTPAPDVIFGDVVGKVFDSNPAQPHPFDKRGNNVFSAYPVVHLYHPSFFVRGADPERLAAHHNQHIPAVVAFMQTLDL